MSLDQVMDTRFMQKFYKNIQVAFISSAAILFQYQMKYLFIKYDPML